MVIRWLTIIEQLVQYLKTRGMVSIYCDNFLLQYINASQPFNYSDNIYYFHPLMGSYEWIFLLHGTMVYDIIVLASKKPIDLGRL